MINEEKMEMVLLALGFPEHLLGTRYLREAVRLWAAGRTQISCELYPGVAAKFNTTPQRVERAIRHAIEVAWVRGDQKAQMDYFGWTVAPDIGRPKVGECIARLARVCYEN